MNSFPGSAAKLPSADEIINRANALTALKPFAVGFALSPRMKALLDRETRGTSPSHQAFTSLAGAPFIVDPRLADKGEAYYDAKAWKERCAEQRRYDSRA